MIQFNIFVQLLAVYGLTALLLAWIKASAQWLNINV